MKKVFRANTFTAEFNDEGDYFSLTGYVNGVLGAVGDKIADLDKRFLAIEKMHLSNSKTGEPMHAEDNAFYHAKLMDKKTLIRTLRCTSEQADQLVDLAFRINGSQERLDEIEPYRHHQCSLDKGAFVSMKKAKKEFCSIYHADQQMIRYKRCHYGWLAKVEFSSDTQNLSGERTHFCPKCNKKPQWSSEWVNKEGETYKHLSGVSDLKEELANLYNIHYTAKNKWNKVFKELRTQWLKEAKETYTIVESIPADLREEKEDVDLDDFNESEKVQALAKFLDCPPTIIEESSYNDNIFSAEGSDWLVVDDDEADEMLEEDLENYVDDCILPEIDTMWHEYFNKEKWVQDTMALDERGSSLNRYDGIEHRVDFGKETYFIYQQ